MPPPSSSPLPLDDWTRALGVRVTQARPPGMPDDIRLLQVALPLGTGDTALQASLAYLAQDEPSRLRRYYHFSDRLRFGVTRALLRHVLAWHGGNVAPADVILSATATGRPQCRGSGLDFNVSHSGAWSCIAFSTRRRVGLDVETIMRQALPDSVQALALTDAEMALLRPLSEAARHAAFLTAWTRKEAVLKACGLGITEALRAFTLCPFAAVPPPLGQAWTVKLQETAQVPVDNAIAQALQGLRGIDWTLSDDASAALAWSDPCAPP